MRIPDSHRTTGFPDSETMTPMIDVVFLLLVFFICASVGQEAEESLEAVVQDGTTAQMEPQQPSDPFEWTSEPVIVRIRHLEDADQLEINETPAADLAELDKLLREYSAVDSEAEIILRLEDEVAVQTFISAYEICRSVPSGGVRFGSVRPVN